MLYKYELVKSNQNEKELFIIGIYFNQYHLGL